MKWRNHLDIADAVAESLPLSSHHAEILRQASIEPDRQGERVLHFDRKGDPHLRWMRHHGSEAELIESLAWKGRRAFLKGKDDDAVWCLGKALHFLQDHCVHVGLFGARHDLSESAMAALRVSRETVASGASMATVSVSFMRECIRSAKPCRDPVTALDQAALLSGALAASVLRGRSPDRRLLEEWRCARRRFRMMIVPVSLSFAIGAPVASLLADEPAIALFALPVLLAPLYLLRYRYLKDEMAWFGH